MKKELLKLSHQNALTSVGLQSGQDHAPELSSRSEREGSQIPLPILIECDMLPDDMLEIPMPEIANHYKHLKRVVGRIPALDPSAAILILLCRDIPQAHKV